MSVEDPQQLTYIIGELYAIHRMNAQKISDMEAEIQELKSHIEILRSEIASSAYTVHRGEDE